MKTGQIVTDMVDDLGEGRIIDVYNNQFCGADPVRMLTVDFGDDQIFDRLPSEVKLFVPQAKGQSRADDAGSLACPDGR